MAAGLMTLTSPGRIGQKPDPRQVTAALGVTLTARLHDVLPLRRTRQVHEDRRPAGRHGRNQMRRDTRGASLRAGLSRDD